jgi:hypothetical protein
MVDLHQCAGPNCPGYPYKASDMPHPATCTAQPVERVRDDELAALVASAPDVEKAAPEREWTFHRIQEGYPDRVPRAVFVSPNYDESIGIPLIRNVSMIMALAVSLAREVATLREEREEREERETLREKARAVCADAERSHAGPSTSLVRSNLIEELLAEVDRP